REATGDGMGQKRDAGDARHGHCCTTPLLGIERFLQGLRLSDLRGRRGTARLMLSGMVNNPALKGRARKRRRPEGRVPCIGGWLAGSRPPSDLPTAAVCAVVCLRAMLRAALSRKPQAAQANRLWLLRLRRSTVPQAEQVRLVCRDRR